MPIPAGVRHRARRLVGERGREVAKRAVVATAPAWDPVYVAAYRRRTGWSGPIPAFNNRRKVAAWKIDYFVSSGQRCADDVAARLRTATGADLGDLDVLDLACGPARIASHLAGTFRSLTASDVDGTAVEYVQRHVAGVTGVVNRSLPPLPFADDTFDAVYSWSLWTHLPVDLQRAYLVDLRRILRPGGVAVLTTNGHPFLDEYQAYPGAEAWWLGVTHERLRTEGCVYHEFDFLGDDTTDALTGVTASFGLTFHDPAWIEREWKDLFTVEAVDEAGASNHQDFVTLRQA